MVSCPFLPAGSPVPPALVAFGALLLTSLAATSRLSFLVVPVACSLQVLVPSEPLCLLHRLVRSSEVLSATYLRCLLVQSVCSLRIPSLASYCLANRPILSNSSLSYRFHGIPEEFISAEHKPEVPIFQKLFFTSWHPTFETVASDSFLSPSRCGPPSAAQ